MESKDHVPERLARLLSALDAIAIWSGKAIAWLILPMVLSLVYEVVSRYVFDQPTEWAYDITYMLYGALFMVGAAFTLQRGKHIRTDLFYGRWSPRVQGAVDAACYLLFFFPGMIAFLVVGWDFFTASYARNERIVVSSWMPVIYPLKFVIPLATALLVVQGVSELIKSVWAALKGNRP